MKRIIPERTGLNLSILNIIMALNKEKIQEQITIKEESIMITWKNLDTLDSFKELSQTAKVDVADVMKGEGGAERVKKYSTPMAEGLA